MTSVSITENDTIDVLGLNDINADLTLGLPQPLKTDSVLTLGLPQPLKTDTVLTVKPLKADIDTDSHLKIDPLKTDSSVFLDVKPVVLDLCLTLNVGKIPNLCIKSPYHHHIGFTMWGSEIWGCTFRGEQETVIQEQRPQPKVALGRVAAEWPGHHAHHPEPGHSAEPPTRETGGLRIRLGP